MAEILPLALKVSRSLVDEQGMLKHYPIMLMTEEKIRSVASIFTEGENGLAVVDLFGDMRCAGTVWNIPLTFAQVLAIVSR